MTGVQTCALPILELLQQTEQLSTFELAESLDVSISTIRRDLNLLEEKNEIGRASCRERV